MVSLNKKRALSLMVPCADGIVTVSCLRNIRSAVTRLDRPSIICSNSLNVCCCCSSSKLSLSVQFISSSKSWISFCASNRSLWSGCDWSVKNITSIYFFNNLTGIFRSSILNTFIALHILKRFYLLLVLYTIEYGPCRALFLHKQNNTNF